MANGLPTTRTVEIEYSAGVWTDVTDSVSLVSIREGRSGEFEDITPGIMTFTLRAPVSEPGRWIPSNPTSTVYPNFARGKRVRASVTDPGVALTARFYGFIDGIDPDGSPIAPDITVTCFDSFGMLAQRPLRSYAVEHAYTNTVATANNCQIVPMDEAQRTGEAPTLLQNTGNYPGQLDAYVERAGNGEGTIEIGVPSGMYLDGMATFMPGDTQRCPVVRLPLNGMVPISLQFSFICSAEVPVDEYVVMHACDSAGNTVLELSIKNVAGSANLNLYAGPTATLVATIATGVNSGVPYWVYMWQDVSGAGSINFGANTTKPTVYYAGGTAADLRDIDVISLGGIAFSKLKGKQYRCMNGQIGGLVVADYVLSDLLSRAIPGLDEFTELFYYTNLGNIGLYASPFAPFAAMIGSGGKTITPVNIVGSNMVAVYAQLCRTTGGVAYVNHVTGNINYRASDSVRPTTAFITIDIEQDGVSQPTWVDDSVSAPTRVTSSWSGGTRTVIDTVSEDDGIRREASVDTCAANSDDAYDAAAYRLNRSAGFRISSIEIDLVTASNDLYLAISNMTVSRRVRITGIASAIYGYSYAEFYVAGYTETWTDRAHSIMLDLFPADAPGDGVYDSATYGRYATDDATTLSAGITSSATTLAIATASGPTFTTSAAEYPLDINLAGERVTLNNAPAGAVSPQTFTGVTRGVAPTVARAHLAADPIEIWNAAAYALG